MSLNQNIQHVVLLNGWSATSRLWADFFDSSFESYSVEIIDLDEDYSVADYCHLLDRHMKGPTLLIAWSLGGALALHYAAVHRSREQANCLKAVVVLQTSPCFVEREDWSAGMNANDFLSLQALVEKGDKNLLVKRFAHLMVSGSENHKQDRTILKVCYQSDYLPPLDALKSGLSILNTLDLRAVINLIQVPSLWLFGAKDVLVSGATSDYVHALLANQNAANVHPSIGRCEVLDQMAHLPCGVHANVVRKTIIKYLEAL